jgi:hypothetical protein
MNRNLKFAAFVILTVAACSYVNGKGDAEKFVEDFTTTHLADAKTVTHHCQGRDTDENDYISCTLTVNWGIAGERPEIIPIECAVNRAGNGCSNEGCRPLATFGRRGGAGR